LIGFGASSQPNLRLDNRLWARQVAAFLEHVVGAPAVLVGNSLGALVALSFNNFSAERSVPLLAELGQADRLGHQGQRAVGPHHALEAAAGDERAMRCAIEADGDTGMARGRPDGDGSGACGSRDEESHSLSIQQ
jgi:hypothetical protein